MSADPPSESAPAQEGAAGVTIPAEVQRRYESLLAFDPGDDVPTGDLLAAMALLVDASSDLARAEGHRRALAFADRGLSRSPSAEAEVLLHYFSANSWAGLQAARVSGASAWDWEQPEIEGQLVCLRRAVRSPGFVTADTVRRCQILTNLGNLFSQIGRCVEAVEHWDRALDADPSFAMARANRGFGLCHYANALYDEGHRHVLLWRAHEDLTAGLGGELEPQSREVFEGAKRRIEEHLTPECLAGRPDLDAYPLGRGKEERRYREWCLRERLFLNPLNDLGPVAVAARDVFSNPSVRVALREGPTCHGFFNQLKQEFVSARFFLYEGTTATRPHFSDRDVSLHDTLDYPAYGLAAEKARVAFRMAYSLLDKAAYLINDYLRLGIPEKRVSFRGLWYVNQEKKRGLLPDLQSSDNWPLRGLFWLGKDLFEDAFQEVVDPDARALVEFRNHAEHKYLKLHDIWSPEAAQFAKDGGCGDRLAYSVARGDFEARTLRLLKLVRAAIIYLSLAMHHEERRRAEESGQRKIAVPLHLPLVEHRDKR